MKQLNPSKIFSRLNLAAFILFFLSANVFANVDYSFIPGFEGDRLPATEKEWEEFDKRLKAKPLEYTETLAAMLKKSIARGDEYAELRILLAQMLESKFREDLTKTREFVDKLLPRVEASGYKDILMEVLFMKLQLTDSSVSDEELEELIARTDILVRNENSEHSRLTFLQMTGRAYFERDYYYLTLEYFLQALELARKLDDEYVINNLLTDVANTFGALEHLALAMVYYEEALSMLSREEQPYDYSIVIYSMGVIQTRMGNLDEAKELLETSREISLEIGDELGVQFANQSLGEIALQLNDTQAAIDLLNEASVEAASYGQMGMELTSKIALAKAYNQAARYDDALRLLNDFPENVGDYQRRSQIEMLAQTHTLLGNLDKAVAFYNNYIELDKKIQREMQSENINRTRVQLEDQKNLVKAQLLEKELALKQAQVSAANSQRRLFILLMMFVSLSFVLAIIALYQQSKRRKQMTELALTDVLTKAPNRRAVLQQLSIDLKRANDGKKPLAVCLLDIDHFKKINDQYGHEVGDYTLVAFAEALDEGVNSPGHFGRYGGEEWLVVLPNFASDDIEAFYQRICDLVEKKSVYGLPDDQIVRFSAGFSFLTKDDDAESIVNRADECLYQAKEAGRAQYRVCAA